MGEAPGAAALAGGAIVLAAVVANAAFAAWRGARSDRTGEPVAPMLTPGP
jgi:hypothetical protein